MNKSSIINKILTSILVIGVFCLSIPHYSYAYTEDDPTAGAAARQNAALNNTTVSTQSTGGINQNIYNQGVSNYRNTIDLSNTGSAAQTTQTSRPVQAVAVPDGQADAFNSDTSNATGASAGAGGAVSDALECSASSLLGQAVATGLKSLVSKAVGTVTSALTSVPISANAVGDNIDKGANAADAQASTNAFQQIFGVPFGASFNGIAFCIVNGLITYIADTTIAWANSGFQGNPAFLENPETFFQTLADRQASQFISSVAYNTTGINVCEPFRVDLSIALSESYANSQGTARQSRLSCSMDQLGQNFQNFANGGGGGGSIDGYWSNWNQLRQDENNPWGTYIEAGEYLRAQVAVKENTAKFELGLNNGFLNFKKCEDPVAAKKGDTSSCKSTTPGALIQSSLEDTLKIPKERLVAAEKIDQVITALANALIKKALNKVLEQ